MANTQTFKGIDAAKWERIKAAVQDKAGIAITADAGEGKAKGLGVRWAYRADVRELDCTVTSKPWPLSQSFVESKLAAAIGGA